MDVLCVLFVVMWVTWYLELNMVEFWVCDISYNCHVSNDFNHWNAFFFVRIAHTCSHSNYNNSNNNNNKLNRVRRFETALSSWWLKQVSCEKAENKINQLAWEKSGVLERFLFVNTKYRWTVNLWVPLLTTGKRRERKREKVLKINTDADTAYLKLAVRTIRRFTALIAMTIPSHPHGKCRSIKMINECHKQIYTFFIVTLCSSAEQQCANSPPVFVRLTSQNQSQPICSDSVRSLLQLFALVSSLFPERIQQNKIWAKRFASISISNIRFLSGRYPCVSISITVKRGKTNLTRTVRVNLQFQ